MDTQLQNFWVENINKEASLRFAWHLRYSKQFAKNSFQGQGKPKRSKLNLDSTVSERIKRIESEKQQRNPLLSSGGGKKKAEDSRLSKSDGALSMRDMRPPSVQTRSLLYSGISAHGEGRYAYLKKRKALTPEQKYEFPILSSCQYGWKIMDFTNPKPSPYARACVIKDSFYRNSGIILG